MLSNTGMLTGQQLGSRIRDYDIAGGGERRPAVGGEGEDGGLAEAGAEWSAARQEVKIVERVSQLPPALPEFAGRQFELEEMAAAANGGIRVIGLQGTGGVGKTTLAVRFAHQMIGSYPDSQIYIDLKGGTSQPLPVADAQGQVIRSFMPEMRLPEHEVELTRLYQSILSGKRAMLLLDNAASLQQVTPLLPPDGWLTILTSRQNIHVNGGNGLFAKQLQVLTAPESTNLLQQLVPRINNTEALRIAELCGNLPLAIKVVAGAMRHNPQLPVSDFAVRLTTRQLRGPYVEGVLQSCYELLSPGLQQLWRFLAPFQATFDLQAVVAVWRISPQVALETMRKL
ncbi:MAG: NB-ARC domain-containing protein, partial [Acidobacteriota bacterium]